MNNIIKLIHSTSAEDHHTKNKKQHYLPSVSDKLSFTTRCLPTRMHWGINSKISYVICRNKSNRKFKFALPASWKEMRSHHDEHSKSLSDKPHKMAVKTEWIAIYKKYEFPGKTHFSGGVTLTFREMETIELLLQLKSVKEIAYLHKCSPGVETKRILNIKKKLGCEGRPLSGFFEALKKKGIISSS